MPAYIPGVDNGFGWYTALLYPYIKSTALYTDPLLGGNETDVLFGSGGTQSLTNMYEPDFGYNYAAFSPVIYQNSYGANFWPRTPVNDTSFSNPSSLIKFGEKYSQNNTPAQPAGYFFNIGFGNFETLDSIYAIAGPDCNDIIPLCVTNWGANDGSSYTFSSFGLSAAEGGLTAGTTFRKGGIGVFAFADGHAKTLSQGAAAAGTNFSATLPANQLQVTNKSAYLWGNF
jgi:prepilin-type processing-associated H-X9-DG protein